MNNLRFLTLEEEDTMEDQKFPVLLMLTREEYEVIYRVVEWHYDFKDAYDAGEALSSICRDAEILLAERAGLELAQTTRVQPSDEEVATA
jgi:hypothetical protein